MNMDPKSHGLSAYPHVITLYIAYIYTHRVYMYICIYIYCYCCYHYCYCYYCYHYCSYYYYITLLIVVITVRQPPVSSGEISLTLSKNMGWYGRRAEGCNNIHLLLLHYIMWLSNRIHHPQNHYEWVV
jgi:hypothetical protein